MSEQAGRAASRAGLRRGSLRSSTVEREALFRDAIAGPEISMDRIRSLAFHGVPTELRPTYWKILLHYLPLRRLEWTRTLEDRRLLYHRYVTDFYVHSSGDRRARRADGAGVRSSRVDHPLSTDAYSSWNTFFEDSRLIQEIEKDVARTLPHLQLFNKDNEENEYVFEFLAPTQEPRDMVERETRKQSDRMRDVDGVLARARAKLKELSAEPGSSDSPMDPDDEPEVVAFKLGREAGEVGSAGSAADDAKGEGSAEVREANTLLRPHPFEDESAGMRASSRRSGSVDRSVALREPSARTAEPHRKVHRGPLGAMLRELFIYAKLNTAVGYVQGMNDVLAPILHTFACDPECSTRDAEADALFCFSNLMSLLRDNFLLDHDLGDSGIDAKMARLDGLLQEFDYKLWFDLFQKKVIPQFYSFRWISICLAREFLLPDVVRYWDSILSHESGMDFLLYICCAMLIAVRESVLRLDYSGTIEFLQSYPGDQDPSVLIAFATDLWLKHHPDSPGVPPSPLDEPRPFTSPSSAEATQHDSMLLQDASHSPQIPPGSAGGTATKSLRPQDVQLARASEDVFVHQVHRNPRQRVLKHNPVQIV